MVKSALQLGEPVGGGITAWVNKKIAIFLGDYEDGRQPRTYPSPYRAAIRILFVGVLLIGLVLLLTYYFLESPEVKVVQTQQLGPGGKNHNYPITMLYDRKPPGSINGSFNESYGGRAGVPLASPRPPLSCPCSTTSVRWRKFVSVYDMTVKSTSKWQIQWNQSCQDSSTVDYQKVPCVQIPPRNSYYVNLLQQDIVVDPIPLNGSQENNEICDRSTFWNITDDTFLLDVNTSYVECYWLASLLFYNSSTFSESASTETRSTDVLETPMLLDREAFFMSVAQLAREGVVQRRSKLSHIYGDNSFVQKYYDGVTQYLTELLDRGEIDEYWQSFYEGAYYLQGIANFSVEFEPENALVFLVTPPGVDSPSTFLPTFLHVHVDWTQYYETCAPKYCERIQNLHPYQQAIKALSTVGGLSSFVLATVTWVLWPAIGFLLNLVRKNVSVPTPDFPL